MKIFERLFSLFRPKSDLYVIGSSILWGQGHKSETKIHRKVADFIRTEFKENPSVHLLAHSGALLRGGPDLAGSEAPGEIPTKWPSVCTQIRLAPKPRSGRVRILLEGGINEVGGVRISSPNTSRKYIEEMTKQACYHDLKEVLDGLFVRFPQAEVYVLGYYQILADRVEGKDVVDMLDKTGLPPVEPDDDYDLAERAIENSKLFRELSDHWLNKASEEASMKNGASCTFVNSGFEEGEGMFGRPTLLFHPWSKDPMMGNRAKKCVVAIAKNQTGLYCFLAATAHPNEAGVSRYVSQIIAALREKSLS